MMCIAHKGDKRVKHFTGHSYGHSQRVNSPLKGGEGSDSYASISNTPSTSGQTTTFLLKVSQGSTARQFLWSSLSAFKWQKYWQPGTGWVLIGLGGE